MDCWKKGVEFNMRRVLIFTGGYLPGKKYGGPVVSISNFVNLCGDNLDIYIVTSNHDLKDSNPYPNIKLGWNQVGKAKVLYCQNADFNFKSIKNIVSDIKPDIIYQNSFFDAKRAIPLLLISKRMKIRMVLAPRGELFESVLSQKSFKKAPYLFWVKKFLLNEYVCFQATTETEKEQIRKRLDISSEKIFVLENVPSLPVNLGKKSKKQAGILNLVYISRIHPQKNLYFALESLKKIKGKVRFDIYGPKEMPQYWEACTHLIKELPSDIQVRYCGIAERENIHQIYSENDAMILPTISENYGHSIVEAMLSNCPVIISDNTPWTDINQAEVGWAISLSRQNDYSTAIQQLVNLDEKQYQRLVKKLETYIGDKLKVDALKKQYNEFFNK